MATPPTSEQRPPGFTCPRCGRTSYHPEDLRQGYCGACHDFTGCPAAVEEADVEHLAEVIAQARLSGIVAGPATLARYILAAGYRRWPDAGALMEIRWKSG